jgi:HEPN domain-containing protein
LKQYIGVGVNANLEEGLRWVEQAERDFKDSKILLNNESYASASFYAQQAAEKALKGFLYAQGLRALVTHSVADLVRETIKFEKVFEKFQNPSKELDRHYIGARYPNFYPSGPAFKYYTREVAERCLSYAESILTEVRKFLKK